MSTETAERRVRNPADTELQGRAVRYQACDLLTDLVSRGVGGMWPGVGHLLLDLYCDVDEIGVELSVTEGIRHLRVELSDDEGVAFTSLLHGCRQDVDFDAE